MNKIFYGDVQPNHKEHKIWVDSKGVIKTYNNEEDKWVELTNNETPSDEVRTIKFSIETETLGVLEYSCKENQTWGSWIFSVEEPSWHGFEFIWVEMDTVHVDIWYDILSESGTISDVEVRDVIEENRVYKLKH